MGKLLSVGEMVIDFLPGEEEGSYIRKAGGAPANVAIAVARQGLPAAFCGVVGDDDFGRFLYRTLEENGVEAHVELTGQAATTMAFVSLTGEGERSFTFARKPGADMFLNRDHISPGMLADADIVHAGSCSLSKGTAADATAYAMEEARRLGKMVSFDVNYREPMWDSDAQAAATAVRRVLPFVDLLKLSDEETWLLGGEGALHGLMKSCGIALAVVTLGSRGARCYWQGGCISMPAKETECVDSCGAGDAYWGGFLSVLLKEGALTRADLSETLIRKAMERGNIAGWLCVQRKGAIESLPTGKDIERYIRESGQ